MYEKSPLLIDLEPGGLRRLGRRLLVGQSGQVTEEFKGIDAIGIIFKARLLRFAEGCKPAANDGLNIGMIPAKGWGKRVAGAVIRIVKDANRTERRIVPGEQNGFVGHVDFFVQDEERQLVVVIVLVFDQLREVIVFPERLEKMQEIIVVRHIELGYVAAPEAKILINVVGKRFEFGHRLFARQQCDGGAVSPDDVRILCKVIFEVSGRVVAAGGNIGIAAIKPVGKSEVLPCVWIDVDQVLQEVANEDFVACRRLDELMMAGNKNGQEIMKANQGDVAGHGKANGAGCRRLVR